MVLDDYFLYFFIYAVIGYICEIIYCSIPAKRLVNRGFLHGPYLPIYGFGALLVIIPLLFFTAHPVLVFFMAVILTSCLEYGTSVLLEKIFHTKLWDYSNKFINIHGRVCLLNSTLFGLLGLAATYGIHPRLVRLVARIPLNIQHPLATVLLFIVTIDATSSVFRMTAFQKQLREFRTRVAELESRLEILRKQVSNPAIENLKGRLTGELADMRIKMRHRSRRIFSSFPSITARNEEVRKQLELLKDEVKTYRERARKRRRP